MCEKLNKKKELCRKIETVRELLHIEIEKNSDKTEIQQVSENLDKLIVDYLKECYNNY